MNATGALPKSNEHAAASSAEGNGAAPKEPPARHRQASRRQLRRDWLAELFLAAVPIPSVASIVTAVIYTRLAYMHPGGGAVVQLGWFAPDPGVTAVVAGFLAAGIAFVVLLPVCKSFQTPSAANPRTYDELFTRYLRAEARLQGLRACYKDDPACKVACDHVHAVGIKLGLFPSRVTPKR